jgi:exopolyphosphatase/guanosine-5'-triphosphate,3'-diphosphate pyrophosphatase
MPSGPVAIIDIGSNSIKILIATRAADGNITALRIRTIDARISAGISRSSPRLGEAGIGRGVEAVRSLLADAAELNATTVILVATSAVRDALNGVEFCARVHAATGHPVRVLTGNEEANLIGRGLTADPALRNLRNFYVFDLGGGSLECLAFTNRTIQQAISLPLGCVRLTEKLIPDPTKPVSMADRDRVTTIVKETIAPSSFTFSLTPDAVAVGTGGTVTTVRAIFGAREGKPFTETDSIVTVIQIRQLIDWLGGLPLAARQQIAGLPPARADVFPVALITLLAIADVGGFTAFQNSVYNLRYGLAAEALT